MTSSMWTPRNIYLYLVCLITLVIVIFGTVNLVRAVVELVYPEPMPEVVRVVRPAESGQEATAPPQPSEEEIAAQQRNQRRWALRHAVLNIVGNGALLLLAGPLYLYHWHKIQQEAALRQEMTS